MRNSYFDPDDINAPTWDTNLVKKFLPFLMRWKLYFLSAILLILVSTLIQIYLPWLLGQAVDHGIKKSSLENLVAYSLYYIIGFLAYSSLSAIISWILQYAGQKVLHDLRNTLFIHLQKLPITFFDRNPVGRLVTRLTNDVATLAELFSSTLITVFGDIFVLIGIAAMMLYLNLSLGIATLLTSPILISSALFLKSKMREAFRKSRAKLAMVNASLAENIAGMSVTQIFNQEEDRAQKFDVMNTDLKKADLESVFYNSFFAPTVTCVNALTLAVLIIYGGHLIQIELVSIGLLVSFITYAQKFFEPVRRISEKIGVFQSAMASAERVFSILEEKEEDDEDAGLQFVELKDKLEFKNLSFAYEPSKPILKNLSFQIKKGEKVAIVGHTGAGKSTLASLLKKFYSFEDGDILIDDISIKDYSTSSIRKKIGLIQQEVNIFSGTIIDNIFLQDDLFDKDKLDTIIDELEMKSILDKMPRGLESEIYEKGSNISAGQRQLIAFSRALTFNPSILVLDEATSSMDSETESIIQRAVKKVTQNRTSMVIAHRLSTIKHCDHILVLHKGELVEQGTHEELLALKGYYYRLYEIQFADNQTNGK